MENGFTTLWREAREEGRQEGRLEGRQEGLEEVFNSIKTVQKKLNMSFDEAAAFLEVSKELLDGIRLQSQQ